jgi:hypothetical protein
MKRNLTTKDAKERKRRAFTTEDTEEHGEGYSRRGFLKRTRALPKLMYPDRLTSAAKAGNGC